MKETTAKIDRNEQKNLIERYRGLLQAGGKNNDDIDYECSIVGYAVELGNGQLFLIRKQNIKTSFCYDDSYDDVDNGPTSHEMCDRIRKEANFKRANMEEFDEEMLRSVDRFGKYPLNFMRKRIPSVYSDRGYVSELLQKFDFEGDLAAESRNDEWFIEKDRPSWELTESDYRRILHGWKLMREQFRKRLDSYWKRYGSSKLRTWTYWGER